MDVPYSMSDMKRAAGNPRVIHNELRKFNRTLNRSTFGSRSASGVDVMDRDWDNLIILDGCRSDVFDRVRPFDGTATPVYSNGAHSNEFLQENFADGRFHDTVYVTANPWSERLAADTFYLHRTTYTEDERGGEARLPGDVADLAVETFERHPDKRYIVHFMQPNNPYVGPQADACRTCLLERRNILCTEMSNHEGDPDALHDTVPNLRRALRKGYIQRDKLLEVYAENLRIVADHARRVMDALGGRTVITSDHGDMFGERLAPLFLPEYSHWEGVHCSTLREVPWLLVGGDRRRSVEAEVPHDADRIDTDSTEAHLRDMGYLSG